MTTALFAFAFVFALSFAAGLVHVVVKDRKRRVMRARMAVLALPLGMTPASLPDKPARALPRGILARLLAGLRHQIDAANLPLSPARALLGVGGVTVLVAILVQRVAGVGPLVAVLTGGCLAVGAGCIALRQWTARRRLALLAPLPEALDTLSRGLRAGRGLPDAFGFLASGTKGPLGQEFARVGAEVGHGASAAEALSRMARRLSLPEVDFLSCAVSIQSETGGNLAATLENLARAIRERRKIEAKGRALSAEMRASALILAALPVGVGGMLATLNPAYMAILVDDSRGRFLLGYAALSVLGGVAMMKRMGRLDD